MKAQEWDELKKGDKVLAKNGPYVQHGIVDQKWKDGKGMRWIKFHWFRDGMFRNWANKRYLSVELDK